MRRSATAVATAVLAAGVLAGVAACGGSGSSAPTTAAATSAQAGATESQAATGPAQPGGSAADGSALGFDPAACPLDEGYEAALGCYLDGAEESLNIVWGDVLAGSDAGYAQPAVQVFDEAVDTGCGAATADQGPFYCPADQTVYLQREFMVRVGEQAGAEGPYSGVIVLAHEWGHHIQNLIGYDADAEAALADELGSKNAASVRTELMADCLAGWWSGQTAMTGEFELSEADAEDAFLALAEVGDDFQAEAAGAQIDPETWDHGSADQRTFWLATGLDAGAADQDPLAACDTYTIPEP